MASTSRLQPMWACAAVIAGFLCAAACAHAQGQPWRHGIIEPKSDAGFQVMAVRGGFAAKQGLKLDLPHFQNDAANGRWYERLMRAFVSRPCYAWPARTRRPGIAPVCSPRSKVGVPAKSVAT